MLSTGDVIDLAVEKPAAGGRMIARHQGQVVFVLGAVPGERVSARIDRVEKQLAFASVIGIGEPSPDRRDPRGDPRCGGCLYAHIEYSRQVELKADLVADAFNRIGRIAIERPVIAASPEHGHRMRARLHVHGGRPGFYLEGTHQLCDAAGTGQLRPDALEAVARAVDLLQAAALDVASIEVAENIAGDQRALHIELSAASPSPGAAGGLPSIPGVAGYTIRSATGPLLTAGLPIVSDPLSVLTGRPTAGGTLTRRPASFFQANRFLVASLVGAVVEAIPPSSTLVDLYAGVGLFSVSLASLGRAGITAIEGDQGAGADLRENARPFQPSIHAIVDSVEQHLGHGGRRYGTVLVDPPRTGLSKPALEAVLKQSPARIVYVSCDPPTLARDSRRVLDGGYRLTAVQGFDLFPNTPHVEVLAVFDR
jgi:23S rRNA (uracil1939-C5)-methyltransferase